MNNMSIKSTTDMANLAINCFGESDKVFAGHPTEEKKARELRKLVKSGEVSAYEVSLVAFGLLAYCGCTQDHIREQMSKWLKYFDAEKKFPAFSLKNQ